MSDYWESWWMGGDAYGRQTRAELDAVAAQESRARSRLENQMRDQQGNLQGQLDRLTQAFVAFVEYEDVRGELNEHADAAAIRKYAREVVPNLVVTGGTGLGDVPPPAEVRDYWLSWAVRGLVSAGTGGDGAALLDRARACDGRRTALLLVLIDAIRREPRFGADDLDATLPTTAEISNAERGVWLAVAEGRLGPAATATLEARLRSLLGTPDPAVVDAWVRGLDPGKKGTAAPVQAAATLSALLRTLAPDWAAAAAATEAAPAGDGSEDPLAETLRALVDEGAPGEADILARMTDARARMGFVEGRPTGDRWDSPAGPLLELLLADLADPATPSGRRELATRLLAPALGAVVDALRAESTDTAPDDRVVHASGLPVTIGVAGVQDPTWRSQLEQKIQRENPLPVGLRPAAYGALALGVVGLVLVVLSPAWLVLAVLGAGLGVAMLLNERRLTKARATTAGFRLKHADDDVAAATAQLTQQHEQSLAAAAEAERSAARLTEVLAGSSATPARHPVS